MKHWRDMTVSEWTRFLEQNDLSVVRVQKPGVVRLRHDRSGNPRFAEVSVFEVRQASTDKALAACETFFEAADSAQELAKLFSVN